MGKGNSMVVLSSDDDEDDRWKCLSTSRKGSLTKSKSAGRSANTRERKRARLSGSRSRSCKEPDHVDEVMLSFEEFDEALNGFKVSAGSETCTTKDLWVDKYRPNSLEELAVHKKKVEEIKTWLEERLSASKDKFMNNVLLVTGPAGVGKSASIHVIATSCGIRVCQWDAPIPTIWLEHMHISTSGLQYTSKLDEFENFLEKTTKYGQITSSCSDGSKLSTILLIDDLPLTNGRHSFERLQRCLLRLVGAALIPTVIAFTNYNKADSSDQNARSMEELQLSLESAGACKVSFNPITKGSIKKTLLRICKEEHCKLTAEEIDQIANTSGGDIRHAITSLQLLGLNQKHSNGNSTFSSCTPGYFEEVESRCNALDSAISSRFGRDETLSLFHALGKFLHNKRETEDSNPSGCNKFLVCEQFSRLPLKMDAPEKVLCQAHGHARPVTDFLHENVLDFLGDEAIDDAWSVSSYLADADMLLASFHGILARHNETENVLQSAAASIAVRGVQYGNTNPLSSRWHAIRKPRLWQVEHSSAQNKNEIMRQRFGCYNESSTVFKASIVATEVKPALKWLGFRASEAHRENSIMEQDSDISEDEIEEW